MTALRDLRFLVTGSASGIGLQLTNVLAKAGARVLACDIADAKMAEHAEREKWPASVRRERHDVTDPESWQRLFDSAQQAWNGLDVVMNVAGFLQAGYVHDLDLRDVDRHFDINTKGVIYGTHLAAKQMVESGRKGHIINVASMAALAPIPGIALYSASKYAVRAFSLAAAAELRPKGIAVTVVCPDPVDTPMLDRQKDQEEAAMTFSAPRVLTVDEVVALMLGPVLRDRPVEVALPSSRKWLARVADVWPELGVRLSPLFQKQGRRKQEKL